MCAFQLHEGHVFVSEGHGFAQKEAPREKKSYAFFHADISFFHQGSPRQTESLAKQLPINEITKPSHFRVISNETYFLHFGVILSLVQACFFTSFVKAFYSRHAIVILPMIYPSELAP